MSERVNPISSSTEGLNPGLCVRVGLARGPVTRGLLHGGLSNCPVCCVQQLAQAIFEWIEAWHNPRRRHGYCLMLSPAD